MEGFFNPNGLVVNVKGITLVYRNNFNTLGLMLLQHGYLTALSLVVFMDHFQLVGG